MKKRRIRSILFSLTLAVLIFAALVFALYLYAVKCYNEAYESRRQPIKKPETYAEFVYIKSTYDKYKDFIGFHKITGNNVISFVVSIYENADKNICDQQISITFYSGDSVNCPYYIKISNCEYINEDGQTRMFDNKNVCYVGLETNEGKYNSLDIISALNAEYIYLGNQSYIDRDRQAFVETVNNTNAQSLIVLYQFYGEDANERKSEYQKTLQTLLPNIQVFCK